MPYDVRRAAFDERHTSHVVRLKPILMKLPPFYCFPVGDSGISIDFGNKIDEKINECVIALTEHFSKNKFPGIIEILPAYSSITLFYDVSSIIKKNSQDSVYQTMEAMVLDSLGPEIEFTQKPGKHIQVPVCYDLEFGIDLPEIAGKKELSIEEIIELHTQPTYHVYMLGFLPGFAYMGEIDDRIAMPRKTRPRLNVEAGSVGIAGLQTGVYPLQSPGGWQILGRTPMQFFNHRDKDPALVRPGDKVKFVPISKQEYYNLL